jgi:hypothetical protein
MEFLKRLDPLEIGTKADMVVVIAYERRGMNIPFSWQYMIL